MQNVLMQYGINVYQNAGFVAVFIILGGYYLEGKEIKIDFAF